MNPSERDRRNIELFGVKGQVTIATTRVAIVGYGGLGSHLGQQLAHLGSGEITVVDPDNVEESNLNRLVGAVPSDATKGVPKTAVAVRVITGVNPAATVRPVTAPADAVAARDALLEVEILFGAVDNDAARLVLTEFCAEHGITYIDVASDAGADDLGVWFGGRVFISEGGQGCLACARELDQREIRGAGMTDAERAVDDVIYGVASDHLDGSGPMVVSVNGVVASLAVTEFIALVTGLRAPVRHLVYRGNEGVVRRHEVNTTDCFYCRRFRRRPPGTPLAS